ncbi:MAG TPA: SiaC family regulatory phosphoprotein, partial [Bordetella sp.]
SGNRVVLNWHYDAEDETILEFGEELRDDFQAIEFTNRPTSEQ